MKRTFIHYKQQRNIFCLFSDGINIRFPGAWGGALNLTPGLDELAVHSVLFDQYYLTSLNRNVLYHKLLTGNTSSEEIFTESEKSQKSENLPEFFRKSGYRTILFTDDETLTSFPGFAEVYQPKISTVDKPATCTEETRLYDIFSQLGSLVLRLRKEDHETPFFLWAQLKGLCDVWDAPLTWRTPDLREMALDGDESSSSISKPADISKSSDEISESLETLKSTESTESTEITSSSDIYTSIEPPFFYDSQKRSNDFAIYREAFCGQLALWDNVLAGLANFLTASDLWNDLLFLMSSACGFSLGEHGQVGAPPTQFSLSFSNDSPSENLPFDKLENGRFLYSESIHVPLLIRFPDKNEAFQRCSALCGPGDLAPLLREWAELSSEKDISLLSVIRNERKEIHSSLSISDLTKSSACYGLITKEWYLKVNAIIAPQQLEDSIRDGKNEVELYVHPDDRWEVNNVADRCEGTVADLLLLQ